MSLEEGKRNYENNTTVSSWAEAIQGSSGKRQQNNSAWKAGLAGAGVENTDEINDEIWSNEWNDGWAAFTGDENRVRSASTNYANSSTAEAWGDGWGDASNWDM